MPAHQSDTQSVPNDASNPNNDSLKPSTGSTTSLTDRLRIPTTYTTLPTQWLTTYQSFVRDNASQVSSLESTLRSFTYLIPSTRFADTPITSESLHTFLSLLTAYHTHLLASPPFSPQRRYERFWEAKSKLYARCTALLRTIQYTQLLLEMLAKRAGEKTRWRVIVLLELIKAVCRLCMGRVSGSRPVIATGVGDEKTERRAEAQPPTTTEEENQTTSATGYEAEWKMPRTGMRLPLNLPLPSSSAEESSRESILTYLTTRAISADDIKSATRLVHTLHSLPGQLAEYLYILRPVIYALLLQHSHSHSHSNNINTSNNTTRKDWRPWLLGLSIDLLSRQLAKTALQNTNAGGLRGLSSVEKEELKRRGWSLAWWVMRGAFYDNVTREWVVKGVRGKLVPRQNEERKKWWRSGFGVGDVLAGVLDDYDFLWGEYYFPSATL